MAGQNLCRLSPCHCPVIQVTLHSPLQLQLQWPFLSDSGLPSSTFHQAWANVMHSVWNILPDPLHPTPLSSDLLSILQLSSQVLLWEAFLDLNLTHWLSEKYFSVCLCVCMSMYVCACTCRAGVFEFSKLNSHIVRLLTRWWPGNWRRTGSCCGVIFAHSAFLSCLPASSLQ